MRLAGIPVVLCLLLGTNAIAQVTLDRPLDPPVPYTIDSGLKPNPDSFARTVHAEQVRVAGAAWLRLYFGDVELEGDSLIRLTSVDGQVQELDRETLALWSHASAYFNGDAVDVELVAAPRTERNRVVIDRLAMEIAPSAPAGGCGICGMDDRVPSNELWSPRLFPRGCSSAVWSENSCVVSAGHCIDASMVVQFNVPPSNPDCTINHPPVEDQFPITGFDFANAGVGNDWSVLVSGPNSLGQRPVDRYGEWRPIATAPPQVGDPLTIWGHGQDTECTASSTQQTSDGAVDSVGPLAINHTVDATFGNSGSALMRNGEEILAIATNCPCPGAATRIDHPAFAAARDALCQSSTVASIVGLDIDVGNLTGGGLSQIQAGDDLYLDVASVPQGSNRHSTLTRITFASPLPSVGQLGLTFEVGTADASPVFQRISLLNVETGLWQTLSFIIVPQDQDFLLIQPSVPNANAYIDVDGSIAVRLTQTSRASQTPGGFTTRIDHVSISVTP